MAASCITLSALSPAAAGETRTLSLYETHTKESLTVTYKKNGRYIPSAMKQLNYLLRDWRRNAVTKMDPKTIDLMWELHADLGSKKPIHIVSAYRSSKTNAMLRRIGRRVARRSRHIKGQAIDLYFPDVPTSRVRGSALVRQVGGVGYYPRSGKSGFVHIDTGKVRHWPRMSQARMARIFRNYRKTVGARRYVKRPTTLFASASSGPVTLASTGPTMITPAVLRKQTVASVAVPKPRTRPIDVLMLAAVKDVQVTPTSAPAPVKNFGETVPRLRDIASIAAASMSQTTGQQSNIAAKGSLTKDILNGTADGTPTIRPLLATIKQPQDDAPPWWPMLWLANADSLLRRDGAPQPFSYGQESARPVAVITPGDTVALNEMIASLAPENQIDIDAIAPRQITAISGKADSLRVNRTGKGDLLMSAPVPVLKRQTSAVSQLRATTTAQLDELGEAILQSIEKPLSFD